MTAESINRKLTAILSADAKGYSRLMGEDEVGTVQLLKEYREIMAQLIHQHRGRVVDSPGDNLLAEFGSVVDATGCAVKIQEALQIKNAELSEDKRLEFRIGINLGDVLEDEDRIYGDGVNIAARIEGLAEPGGICISRTAYDQVKNKLELGYEYLGEHSVKNIAEPVRVYRILTEPEAAGKVIGEKRFLGRIPRKAAMVAIVILVIVAGGLIGWNIYLHQSKRIEPASLDKMAHPLPDKPSIAVLPFDNLSGDPEQEYFSDGLTEEIISALSKVPKLFVIARNSTFTYKGKPVKVQQVSEELGVRYVLEGSVRKVDNQLRITAQLIDAVTGYHLWAERYDRDLKNIFAVQDEITKNIIIELQVQLTIGEEARLFAKGTDNLDAYLKYLQGLEHKNHFNKEENVLTRQMAEEAIALDPQYSNAYSLLGLAHMMDVWLKNTKSPKQSIRKAMELAQKAIALDSSNATAYGMLGFLLTMARQHEKGIAQAEKAVALDPNSALAHQFLGLALRFAGRPKDAIPIIEKAIRLDPFAPSNYIFNLGLAYLFAGDYEKAILNCSRATERESNNLGAHLALAVAYSVSGRDEEALAVGGEIIRIDPNFSVEYFSKTLAYKNEDDKAIFVEALRKAGLK
jgi:adenylate cyclase